MASLAIPSDRLVSEEYSQFSRSEIKEARDISANTYNTNTNTYNTYNITGNVVLPFTPSTSTGAITTPNPVQFCKRRLRLLFVIRNVCDNLLRDAVKNCLAVLGQTWIQWASANLHKYIQHYKQNGEMYKKMKKDHKGIPILDECDTEFLHFILNPFPRYKRDLHPVLTTDKIVGTVSRELESLRDFVSKHRIVESMMKNMTMNVKSFVMLCRN
jgi:hypothetical protein